MAVNEHPDSVAGRLAIGAAIGVGFAIGVGAIVFAGAVAATVVSVTFARTVVTPPTKRLEDLHVLANDADTVTLSASIDSMTPGQYSLWFNGNSGHARVGEIVSYTADTVTRQLLGVDLGDLDSALHGRFGGWFYLHPRDLGFPHRDVEIDTDLGPAPAWLVPAATDTGLWVIGVHGRAVRREEALRAVPVFREAGYSSLLVSYRNDGDAPGSVDNRYSLGDTEWRDVEAAMQFAIDHGAKQLVLMGWSMGGATVLQAVTRSPLASFVRGVVLESPVVDWVTVLHHHGVVNRIPRILRLIGFRLLSGSWARLLTGQLEPINLDRLDFVTRAGELDTPILLLHSDDDGDVPSTASRALAVARPDIVTFESFNTARHARLWNYDGERWNAVIAAWLRGLG